jgi:hypothetical protein
LDWWGDPDPRALPWAIVLRPVGAVVAEKGRFKKSLGAIVWLTRFTMVKPNLYFIQNTDNHKFMNVFKVFCE